MGLVATTRGQTESPKVALTMGDPAGIGPEIALRACEALAAEAFRPIVVGDPDHLAALAAELNLSPPGETIACGSVEPGLAAATMVKPRTGAKYGMVKRAI